jgi:hypothetical protein
VFSVKEIMSGTMRFSKLLVLLSFLLIPMLVEAQPTLSIAHVQSRYAGGGACSQTFDIYWYGEEPISNIQIRFELGPFGDRDGPLTGVIKVNELGVTRMDNYAQESVEMPGCVDNSASFLILAATGRVSDKKIDLLKSGQLEIGEVVRYPIKLKSPHAASKR